MHVFLRRIGEGANQFSSNTAVYVPKFPSFREHVPESVSDGLSVPSARP